MAKRILIALAITAGTATAQPTPAPQPPPAITNDAEIDQLLDQAIKSLPAMERAFNRAVRRARRAISLGPTVGLLSTAFIAPENIDAALTFGMGLETFKVPVYPELDDLQEVIVERVKAQAKERAQELFAGKRPDLATLKQMVNEIYQDVRKEVIAVDQRKPQTMELPMFTIGVEANRLFAADRWLGRVRGGVGIWRFTLGASAAVGRVCRGDGCDDRVKLFAGPEVTVHFLTSKNPRASVIDTFLRGDFQTTGRSAMTYDQVVLGARFLVDLI